MRVITRTVYDWTGDRYIVIAENTRLHLGPVILCKGASSEQKALAAQQQQLSATLASNYNQQFANQSAILSAVKAVYDPILKAGPSQFGFAKPEEAAYRTQASDGTAANYAAAGAAARERLAAAGGGNTFLPTGAAADMENRLAGAAAESESNKQLDITKAGYALGRENFDKATNAETTAAGLYNPLGYAGAATHATDSAFNMADTLQKENGSIWGAVGGIAGGLLGSIAGPMGSAIGSKLGGAIGGIASGSSYGGGNVNSPSGIGVGGDSTGWYD